MKPNMWYATRCVIGCLLVLPTIPFFLSSILVVDGWGAVKDELRRLKKDFSKPPTRWWDEVPPL